MHSAGPGQTHVVRSYRLKYHRKRGYTQIPAQTMVHVRLPIGYLP